MRYLPLLLVSVIYSQIDEQVLIDNDIQRVSEFKRDVAYGQDCDDTEYRDYKGSPAWKGYGGWLSECDSIRSVHLDREFTERAKQKQREKAIQDSIEMASVEDIDFDLDAMWENTVWQEIEDIADAEVYETEQITAVAGVRGAEAEDEALALLYYRRSMKGIALVDLQKAYGKLKIKREKITNPKQLKKIDNLLSQLRIKIQNS
jgi:hypothetical protein|tara:strand:- start:3927 stop:4538 length:612 start_codon:yes stop_codon:yes gene_type:complete